MTTTQRLARFETAQEILGMMAGLLSSKIYRENAKGEPDVVQVAQWQARRTEFAQQELDLRMDDTVGIERVIATYGSQVRAGMDS